MSEPDVESLLPGVPGPRAGDFADGDKEPRPRAGDPVHTRDEPGVDAGLAESGAQQSDKPGRGLAWLRTRPLGRLPGSPPRRSRALPAMLALAVLLGAVAGFVARGFVSPAQEAANAQAPQPSLITAQVRYGVLPVLVSLRATIANGHSIPVSAPSDLGGSLAIVTSMGVRPGQPVGQGQLLFTVAQRPVFVFQGRIPVFRALAPGTRGPDVRQLQIGLLAAGFGTGSDPAGVYGPGTAAAVSALYRAHGLMAATAASAQAPTSGAKHAPSAEIPLGELLFVPRLPAKVGSVARVGATAGSGRPVVTLTFGRATLRGFGAPAQVSLLRPGMRGTAISDFSGQSFPVRVSSVRGQQVVFVPVRRLPPGVAGQNVQVTVTTSQVRTFIVPVAAVSTAGTGQTFVTVATGKGNQTRRVPVGLGLVSGGEQAVTPVRPGSLRAGELVVLGIATSQSKSKTTLRFPPGPGPGPAPGPVISAVPLPSPGG